MTTPTAAPEPFSAEGAALIEAGYPLEAVELLRQAVAGGEPSAPDLLVRAYLESRSWHAAAEWLTPLVQPGTSGSPVRSDWPWWRSATGPRRGHAAPGRRSGDLTAANDLAMLLRDEGRARGAARPGAGGRRGRALRRSQPGGAAPGCRRPAGGDRGGRALRRRQPAETLVMLAEVRAQQGNLDEAERLYRRAGQLGAMRAHTAYGGSCSSPATTGPVPSASSGRPSDAPSPAGRRRSAGSCSTTDGPPRPRLPAAGGRRRGRGRRGGVDRPGRGPDRRLALSGWCRSHPAHRASLSEGCTAAPGAPAHPTHRRTVAARRRGRGAGWRQGDATASAHAVGTQADAAHGRRAVPGAPAVRIQSAGVRRVVLGTSYLAETFAEHFGTAPRSAWRSSTWWRTTMGTEAASGTWPST